MNAALDVKFSPKVKTIQGAATELKNFVRNPPQNPIEALKVFSDLSGASGAITGALTAAFPVAGVAFGAVMGIIDLFMSSGPSIEEVQIDIMQKSFKQLGEQLNSLQDNLANSITNARELTTSSILSGIDEAQREASAADVFKSVNAVAYELETSAQKVELFTEYEKQFTAITSQAEAAIKSNVAQIREKVDEQYNRMAEQIKSMVLSLAEDLANQFEAFVSPPTPLPAEDLPIPLQVSRSMVLAEDLPPGEGSQAKTDSTLPLILGAAAVGLLVLTQKKKR
jgi:hypothetical protein